jgi:hypothetical protein
MSSKKKTSSVSSGSQIPTNSWGWGRPAPPSKDADVFAFRIFPWKTLGLLVLAVPAAIIYGLFGCHTVWFVWWVLYPLLTLLLALPLFTAVILPLSRYLSPAAKGNPEQHFDFKDAAFAAKYKGQKVPIEELYEAFFDDKIALKAGKDLLQVLYERPSYARFTIGWSHVRFFLLQFIPELLTHSRSQDVEQVRTHYDR